ncbi:hypothetical protein BGW36DRAFT_398697 [Talaromyces proteolyticus]|uniref:CFEM domain-containing protein n=1 Tax=Talaromyces proteolyticus TaxID=1131652 RepID=A0AAD4KSD4_9EURO|nr:uncharacterized protein BGW36DRAFT_398697 [Talaromyces proteolyticus]KAH8695477.1 hypothetical protein BGW36DRAFT_398697 [Talaromyces proteolyticus]
MRAFIPVLALAAAASATQMGAMSDAQSCAMQTLLSSTACNTGNAACLCSNEAREAVMGEIKNACGSEQSEQTERLATQACRVKKARRAYAPSGTTEHGTAASPSASAARINGVQEESDSQGCTCANTKAANTPNALNAPNTPEQEDPADKTTTNKMNGAQSGAESSRVHASSMMATPSSSAARHGAMTTPTSSRVATPSGADAFAPFRGAGVQTIPSLTVVAGGVFAGIVGVFAAL